MTKRWIVSVAAVVALLALTAGVAYAAAGLPFGLPTVRLVDDDKGDWFG